MLSPSAENGSRVVTYRSRGYTLILDAFGTVDGRQAKIANFHVPVFINQYVGRLQIAVDNRWLGAVQPVHTQCDILQHFHLLQERYGNLRVVQQIMQRSTTEQFSHDGKISRLSTGSHEQHNVWMAQMTRYFILSVKELGIYSNISAKLRYVRHNFNFFAELFQCGLIHVLCMQFLDGYCFSAHSSLGH